ANLTTKRENHAACLLPDGTVLLAGGMFSQSDPFSLTNAEVYDPNGTVNVPGVGVSDASLLEGDSGTDFMNFQCVVDNHFIAASDCPLQRHGTLAICMTLLQNDSALVDPPDAGITNLPDRNSTRLNSSHVSISYAVF